MDCIWALLEVRLLGRCMHKTPRTLCVALNVLSLLLDAVEYPALLLDL